MHRFIFKLAPVLKLRKLKEENCRMELGRLITELRLIEDQIIYDQNEIQNYYSIQEKSLESGISGNQIKAFPMLISAKDKNLELLRRDKLKQEQLVEEKKQELATLRGELKLIENLSKKEFDEYKKTYNKELDQKIEEQTQNWLHFKKGN